MFKNQIQPGLFWFKKDSNMSSSDQDLLKMIKQTSSQSKCNFSKIEFVGKKMITGDEKYIQIDIIVSICGNYLIFTHKKTQDLIAILRISFQIKFEVLRNISEDPSQKRVQGIKIMMPQQIQKNYLINLTLDQNCTKQFQIFLRKLERKTITQLNFHSNFKPLRIIAKTQQACILEGLRIDDQKSVAIKSFKKSAFYSLNSEFIFRQKLKLFGELNYQNICEYLGVYETQNSVYIIYELLGISLLTYLRRNQTISEKNAKKMMFSLLKSVQYLQSKEIAHRDLKLQKILLRKDCKEMVPVIIGFSLSEKFDSENKECLRCGTPGYFGPQLFNDDYNYRYCDMFSLGVIFYIILTNKPLFEGNNLKEIVQKNKKCEIEEQKWQKIQKQQADLIKKMVEKNTANRITATEALTHPYFSDLITTPVSMQISEIQTRDLINL